MRTFDLSKPIGTQKPSKMTQPKITNELKEAVKTVLTARAYKETIAPTINAIKQSVLDTHVYMIAERWTNHVSGRNMDGTRITNPKDMYLSEEADSTEYFALCHIGYESAGFVVPSVGYCPLLRAESVERDALRAMFEASKYIANAAGLNNEMLEKMYYKLEWMRKYEEATISLVLSICDKNEFTAESLLKAA